VLTTIRVTDFGVFIHKGGDVTWLGGCKSICTDYETDDEQKKEWEGSKIFTTTTSNTQK
jgi:hypothetical protein